jgi:serine protease AprX
MRSIQTVLFVVILLVPSLGSLAIPASVHRAEAMPVGWYTQWFRDADRDHIDDLLQDGSDGASTADIFVDYYRDVTDKDLAALDGFGQRTWVDPYIDVVLLSGVAKKDLVRISELPGVVMVEKQLPIHSMLDISVPNIRGNVSTVYTVGARNLGYDGTGVTVAVFDTGVDTSHMSLDDLDDNLLTNDPKFLDGYDALHPLQSPEDLNGHGTNVAGIAIGTGGPTPRTFIGVAPGAWGVDVKVMNSVGTGNANDFLAGLTWCRTNKNTDHIKVLSMSLGTTASSDGNDTLSRAVNTAVRQDGFVVVAAMGNDGTNTVPAPAAADEAIAVGAYDDHTTVSRSDDFIVGFSNSGPRVSDGDNDHIDELKPDVAAPGVNIMSAMYTTPDAYSTMSGTSQATPHVAGTIAIMLQANPDLTPQDIKKILRDTAQAKGSPYNTVLDPKYNTASGWGMLDAYGAVKRAEDLKKGASIVGPPGLQSGGTGTITVKFKFTRTEFQTTPDNASMNISIPNKWGKPESIAITSSEGVTYTSGHTDPVQGTTNWTFVAWANFTGTVVSPKQLEPTTSFTTFAPATAGTYNFGTAPTLNNAKGKVNSTTVQVTPGGTGKADLFLDRNDISFSNDKPLPGQLVTISAVVHNGGTLGANANVSFFDGPPQTGIPMGVDPVSVPAGGKDTAQVRWLATPGNHTIFVVADLLNQVDETNKKNNEANRTILVVGLNSPPTASLSVDPTNAGVNVPIRFDGHNSTDVDGRVVLYNYNYGDGNSSGWVAKNNLTYAYTQEGIYFASLTVQDNGGAKSSNNPQVMINVQPMTTRSRMLYLSEGYHLLFTEPEGNKPLQVTLPNGIGASNPFGPPQSKQIGTWSSNKFQRNMTIGGVANYILWLNATGIEGIEITNFTFYLKLNDEVKNKAVYAQTTTILPGRTFQLMFSTTVNDIEVKSSDILSLNIWCAINGNNGVLDYGSKNRESGVNLSFTSFQGIAPVVHAGENITARVNTTVSFTPTASDEDGTIIKWEWDFEGSGVWGYASSKTGATTYFYTKIGTYTATVRVTDNDGNMATGSLKVQVLSANRPPVLKNLSPSTSSVTMDAGTSKAFSITASDPDNDPLTFKWYVDSKKRTSSNASFNYSTTDQDVGTHEVKVSVSDGMNTTSNSWTVLVLTVDHPPVLQNVNPAESDVIMNSGETKLFQVSASDPDGDPLTYKWTLDGTPMGSRSSFQYSPEVEAVGLHTVKVVISDGKLSISVNWTLEVLNANHSPIIRSTIPENGAKYKTTDQIPFEVDAYDEDGNTLTYLWTSNLDGTLGREKSVTVSLRNGTHTITIKVDDGKGGSVSKTLTVLVVKPTKVSTSPISPETMTYLVLFVIIVIVVLIVAYWYMGPRRRQLELERAAVLQRTRAAKARPTKATRPISKARRPPPRPVKAVPRKRESLIEKAREEEEEEMGDLPVSRITKVDEGAHARIVTGPKPVKMVPKKVVRTVPRKVVRPVKKVQ